MTHKYLLFMGIISFSPSQTGVTQREQDHPSPFYVTERVRERNLRRAIYTARSYRSLFVYVIVN